MRRKSSGGKKRVVVVRPQAVQAEPEKPVVEKPIPTVEKKQETKSEPVVEKSTKDVSPQVEVSKPANKKPAETRHSQPPRKNHEPFKRTPHTGVSTIKVIDPKDLPPVPGQGQNAQDHAEWRKNIQNTPKPKETGPSRQVGQVGGYQNRPQNTERRPYNPNSRGPAGSPGGAPGSRPPYNNQNREGGYQPRPGGAPGSRPPYNNQNREGGYPPRQGGYQPRPGGAPGSRPPFNRDNRGPNTFNRGPRPVRPGGPPSKPEETVVQKTSKKNL